LRYPGPLTEQIRDQMIMPLIERLRSDGNGGSP
jgi:hypothetical protein